MRLARTNRFKRACRKLKAEEQALADKALRFLASDLRHPSLRVKKIKGTDKIWEARVGRTIRLTFEMHGDLLVLRNIGQHD
jgi:mRNA-degrading endonuclease RelE of RelBE toxin-antitoxin system